MTSDYVPLKIRKISFLGRQRLDNWVSGCESALTRVSKYYMTNLAELFRHLILTLERVTHRGNSLHNNKCNKTYNNSNISLFIKATKLNKNVTIHKLK